MSTYIRVEPGTILFDKRSNLEVKVIRDATFEGALWVGNDTQGFRKVYKRRLRTMQYEKISDTSKPLKKMPEGFKMIRDMPP